MTKTFTLSIILGFLVIVSLVFPHNALSQSSQRFNVKINQFAFSPGDTLILFGNAAPADALFVKLIDPTNKTVRIESVIADNTTGSFTEQIFQWPQPSKNLVFGSYTVQVGSSRFLSDKTSFSVTFGQPGTNTNTQLAATHILAVKLDSPTEISAGKPFRIYVQVTYDGALVNTASDQDLVALLGSSHIHSGNVTVNLSGKFVKLHEGIYYADVQLGEGSYIIHAIAFYQGFLAHDSKVVSSGASIGDINQSVGTLRAELDRTSHELNDTRSSVTKSVDDARAAIKGDVDQLQSASGQINSLILPILALISVIIALQISLFARIRASFR
jgi:hypothetical protein